MDLRQYFPNFTVVTLNKSNGSQSARYTLQRSMPGSPTGIDSLYAGYMNQGKPGAPYMWRKEYFRSGGWCTDTYAVLFMGDDQSVTECGDWYAGSPCTPSVAMGYKKQGTSINTGLAWSGVNGAMPVIIEADVWRQNTPGAVYGNSGVKTYSRTGVVELYPTFTPSFGRDQDGIWREGGSKTYTDVVHIVMYHGTKTPGVSPVRCMGPITANGPYYQSYKDYSSYAIELWLAKDVGIIQENCPFIEDASAWGGTIQNCSGDIFANPVGSWRTYIDQQ